MDSPDVSEGSWDRVSVAAPGTPSEAWSWGASEGGFFVGLRCLPESAPHRFWGKVEWNPSRVVDGEGWGLASVEEALLTVGRAVKAAETRMRPVWSDVGEWSVKRVDVAKDFSGVEDGGGLIRSLGAVHRPWSRKNLTHSDPSKNGAQTLMVGSGAGVVRLYDKHAETKGDAPEGTLRWEVEARKWAESYGSIRRVCDLTGESVEALGRERFGWSGMGAEVVGSLPRLVAEVNACEELSARERLSFLGFLMEQAAGVESSVLSRTTLAKYRRLQRELGLVGSAALDATFQVVRRLDWESGSEVLRLAS